MSDLKGTALSFIGTGVMAEAMIKAILDKGVIEGCASSSPAPSGRPIRTPNT